MYGYRRMIARWVFVALEVVILSAAMTTLSYIALADDLAGDLDVRDRLAHAQPGDVVELPAGIVRQSIVLPTGVTLKGAGYNKTIIEVGGDSAAIVITKAAHCHISDLSIHTQGGAAILVDQSEHVSISRLVIQGGVIGIQGRDVRDLRVENIIDHRSMTGISLAGAADAVVVNCTLDSNNSAGLNLRDCTHTAVFNNLVTGAATGIVVGGDKTTLAVDHNLYVAFAVGKLLGHPSRISLGPWRDVTAGLDAASVQLPVEYAAAARGDFRPVSRLDWAPWQSTVSDWGVDEMAGFHAPLRDIDGSARFGAPDVGAYEVPPLENIEPEQRFDITSDEGTKSAGLFTSGGKLVRYMFHDLPLKRGRYGCTLPGRGQLGEEIAPGNYELRVVESNLRWRYNGITANSGIPGSSATTDLHHTQYVAFTADHKLLLGIGWNERGENLRCLDARTRKPLWSFQGQSPLSGLCVDSAGVIWLLRSNWNAGPFALVALDPTTGAPKPWANGQAVAAFDRPGMKIDGMAALDGDLYFTDPTAGQVYRSSAKQIKIESFASLAAPESPTADRARHLLWLVSNREKVVAIDAKTKKTVCEFTAVRSPVAVAVAGNRLAVASLATGKIELFDASELARIKPVGAIGRGDGPFGAVLPDRFYFQQHVLNSMNDSVVLAMDGDGSLAVRDFFKRPMVFDAEHKNIYASFAQFGNWPAPVYPSTAQGQRFFDSGGDISWYVDSAHHSWQPDARWGFPHGKQNDAVGYFTDQGQLFGVFHQDFGNAHRGIAVVRFENYVGKIVSFYTSESVEFPAHSGQQRGAWVVRHKTVANGEVDWTSPGEVIVDDNKQPITWDLAARFLFMLPDGSLVSPGGSTQPSTLGYVWQRRGLDRHGVPVYRFGAGSALALRERTIPSAYDLNQREDLGAASEATIAPNGDYLASYQFAHSPHGMGYSNSGGVDVVCFNPRGEMKWLRPLNDFGPVQGIKASPNFYLSSWGHQAEWFGMSPDGLGLGHLGFPADAGWQGYWVDHPTQYFMFPGNDGRQQVMVGDYMQNCQHWFTLQNYDNYRAASFPCRISEEKARDLRFRPVPSMTMRPKPEQPTIVIRKLPGPMPMDGKLEKWRDITPQVVMTPVTSTTITSPLDASAVVRLAYHDKDLYIQILRFDDVVTFHQPVSKSHQQDTMEIMINGFIQGFQFSISKFADRGTAVVRRRFFFSQLEKQLSTEAAPRYVDVLPDARDVSERQLIESIYGVDMSKCKVIVHELKLPIDKMTYSGDEDAIFPVRSGSKFWLGLMIDDNDVPGSDTQKTIVWPSTYNTFGVKEDGALAVFE